jgi:hypothetical protein
MVAIVTVVILIPLTTLWVKALAEPKEGFYKGWNGWWWES